MYYQGLSTFEPERKGGGKGAPKFRHLMEGVPRFCQSFEGASTFGQIVII